MMKKIDAKGAADCIRRAHLLTAVVVACMLLTGGTTAGWAADHETDEASDEAQVCEGNRTLRNQAEAELVVFDMLGREVARLVDGKLEAGMYEARWDGRTAGGVPVAGGLYIYQLRAGSFAQVKAMTLVK